MNPQSFELKGDPFPIVPDGPVHNWAGRDELREDLIDLIKGVRARDIGVTEFAILHGEYGAGKSHALRYLKTLVEEDTKQFDSIAIYLERPRVATKLNFLELQRYVVHTIGREQIKSFCKQVKQLTDITVQELAKEKGLEDFDDQSTIIESAIKELPGKDQNMVRLLRHGVTNGTAVFDFLSGTTACNQSGYEGRIDSDFLAASVLSDLFRVITSELRPNERIYESIYLFLDEGEVLLDAKATESELVFSGLRELINGLPYRFGLLISFSAATALIEAIMSQHLLKRMTWPYIEVPMLDESHAKDFLRAQLDDFRIEGSQYGGTFYPFDEDTIDLLVETTQPATPRNLFIRCKRVFERAVRRYKIKPGEKITRDIAEQILVGER